MNPIIRRELLEVLRTPKALVVQFALGIACLALVLVRWPTSDVADLTGARGGEVLRIFGYGLLAGIVLLTPAFPATTLVREKIKGTLALLLNSPLPPWSIYLGKLGGVVGFTALLLAMTLPAAAGCYLLGGAARQGGIVMLYTVLGLAVVQMAALGLLVSAYAQSTDGALRTTYALVLAVCVLPMVPHAFFRGDALIGPAADWFRCLSPVPAVMEVLGHGDVGAQGMAEVRSVFPRYALMAVLCAVSCAAWTITHVSHALLDRARPAGVMTDDRTGAGRVLRSLFFLIDPQRRSRSLGLWVNPVMVKEFRSRRFGRSHWTIRLIALSAILSLALSVAAAAGAVSWGIENLCGGLVLLQVAILILFAPSLAAGLISAERESGTWQLLRMTPLSVGKILRGKLMSVALPLALLLSATLPGYVVLMTVKPELIHRVPRVVISLATTGIFAVLVSAAVSSFFRATAPSMTTSYIVLLTVCVAPFLIWLGRDAPFGHVTVQTVLTVNPVAAALQASATSGFTQYELLPANWWIMGAACSAALVVLTYRTWRLTRPE
ncbi:MAG: ABC transporter permease subunit [Gemmataceae bacterium]|nr:ABC transporter permease subunit [Gemmataceae bacterium]